MHNTFCMIRDVFLLGPHCDMVAVTKGGMARWLPRSAPIFSFQFTTYSFAHYELVFTHCTQLLGYDSELSQSLDGRWLPRTRTTYVWYSYGKAITIVHGMNNLLLSSNALTLFRWLYHYNLGSVTRHDWPWIEHPKHFVTCHNWPWTPLYTRSEVFLGLLACLG
jgi:hypothetical protein